MHRVAIWRLRNKAELLSGLGASLVGLAALAFTLFAPRWRVGTSGANGVHTIQYVSTLQLELTVGYLVVYILLALTICGFALSVMAHLYSRRNVWRKVLLGLTTLLLLWIIYPLSYPTDGLLRLYYVVHDNGIFLPVLVLALAATLLAYRTPSPYNEREN